MAVHVRQAARDQGARDTPWSTFIFIAFCVKTGVDDQHRQADRLSWKKTVTPT
ncbi:hypothetical protein MGYG_07102 [Nannizzia gypsea CBS 118893]|uniref:Uncharacterized protein n=1 Tax=Arthroderma gypseum (strain ATCC MYA-4604 / CBS 118893) TaxID=535722 RepID=E4V230_ARTGP|nr:hypothetical protein MGYG_07102 [Nannizzia gypsea CBS 118893]EFR04095.1 hypothetical protein MGYG_07102 [Nannizzia gypsea CBS 118893]